MKIKIWYHQMWRCCLETIRNQGSQHKWCDGKHVVCNYCQSSIGIMRPNKTSDMHIGIVRVGAMRKKRSIPKNDIVVEGCGFAFDVKILNVCPLCGNRAYYDTGHYATPPSITCHKCWACLCVAYPSESASSINMAIATWNGDFNFVHENTTVPKIGSTWVESRSKFLMRVVRVIGANSKYIKICPIIMTNGYSSRPATNVRKTTVRANLFHRYYIEWPIGKIRPFIN